MMVDRYPPEMLEATLPLDDSGQAIMLDPACNREKGGHNQSKKASVGSGTAAFIIFSFVYAKLLVVVCIAFLVSEFATHQVPLYFFEGFFTYLYGVSILFLLYVFCYLLANGSKSKRSRKVASGSKLKVNLFQGGQAGVAEGGGESALNRVKKDGGPGASGSGAGDIDDASASQKLTEDAPRGDIVAEGEGGKKPRKCKTTINDRSRGSLFLRVGALAFGLGTMIFCGLEFGAFWEIPMTSDCYNLILGINPCLQMAFTFMQMYFIFMNARLNIHKFKFLARFGLMHVVATNLCVWLRTITREALKDITLHVAGNSTGPTLDHMVLVNKTHSMKYLADWNVTCGRVSLIGTIREDSAPFLYPFLVEYSLIGIVVLYIMWKHVGLNPKFLYDADDPEYLSVQQQPPPCRVDCVGASKGLFLGLLVLVVALISLILYFVFIHNPDAMMKRLALYLADASHGGILILALLTILIGFCRVRQLRFFPEREDFVNTLFLRISAFGILLYALFSTIAGSMYIITDFDEPHILVMVVNLLVGVEVFLQALFVNDVARRSIYLEDQISRRPGRQCVTLLLFCNLAMTIIYVFEMQKVTANPVQLNFYGYIPWNVILKLTLPLAIFHRFHASVMLADVWKNTYKVRCLPEPQ